jgi:hypothetical protein
MKTLLYKFTIAFAGTFFVSTAIAQSNDNIKEIHPSAILEIQKTEPAQIKSELQKFSLQNKLIKNKQKRLSRNVISKNFSPKPGNSESENYAGNKTNRNLCPPALETNFEGNPKTPFYLPPVGYYASESSIAVSNSGKIVSLSDGWIRYYNTDGTLTFSDSLYHFCSGLINVRVMYDPQEDRFVFISGYGVTDFMSLFVGYGTMAAFSKTNDPMDGWNFYYLPDSIFNDNSVGDYPEMGISKDEVFITDNRLDTNGNITHSLIIQLDKHDGYAGNPSLNMQSFQAPLGGILQGTAVPAPGGSKPYGPNMYFVMANETGNGADSFFVLEVTNTIQSGNAALKIYGPVHSNISYSPAPPSYQPGNILLNDAYAGIDNFLQNAFYENGMIQFAQNDGVNGKAAVYIGRIKGVPNQLSCEAHTIHEQDLSLSFPQIVYTGSSPVDNSSIVGIEYGSLRKYPGLTAVSIDNNFSISKLIEVKAGRDTINGLWGNYSAICRRYNNPGEYWMEGQYGSATFPNINWIAKLEKQKCLPTLTVSMEESKSISIFNKTLSVFPNPVSNSTNISFSLSQSQQVSIMVYDESGRLIKTIANAQLEPGAHQLTWNANDENGKRVATGMYYLKFNAGNYSETKKLSIVH